MRFARFSCNTEVFRGKGTLGLQRRRDGAVMLNHGDPESNVQWCRTGPYTSTQRYAGVKHLESVARLLSRRWSAGQLE